MSISDFVYLGNSGFQFTQEYGLPNYHYHVEVVGLTFVPS